MLRFRACAASDIEVGAMSRFELPERVGIVIYNLAGAFFASDDACTHKWASLAVGEIHGNYIVCPWHGGAFDITTGQATALPCVRAPRTYPVVVEAGAVMVLID